MNTNDLDRILDSMLTEFPEKDSHELYETYLEWDDTTRLVLDNVPKEKKHELIKKLMRLFWKIALYHDSNTYNQIEKIRKMVLLNYYEASSENDELVIQLMKIAYEISTNGRKRIGEKDSVQKLVNRRKNKRSTIYQKTKRIF